MPILPYRERTPQVGPEVTIADDAYVVGWVSLPGPAVIGVSAVMRGEEAAITIGARYRMGSRATIHVDPGAETHIGEDSWLGDGSVVHGSVLGDCVRVGDGASVLNHSEVGGGSVIADGALLSENSSFPENSYIEGTPGKRVRDTTGEEREETRAMVRAQISAQR